MNRYIVNITMILLVSLMVVIYYWLLWPFQPVEFENDHLQTNALTYKAGDKITIINHFEKFIPISPTYFSRWYENSIILPIPTNPIQAQLGENFYKTTYEIPDFFETGKYHICETLKYQVNPLRVVEYRNCSNSFEIMD